MAGSPRPVSGAEHMAAHFWDMKDPKGDRGTLHGEEVGVALVLVAEHYKKLERAIRHGMVKVRSDSARGLEMELLEKTFEDTEVLDGVLADNDPNPLDEIDLEKLEEQLGEIQDLIHDLPDSYEILQKLNEAGCVTRPEEIGLTREMIENTLQVSPYVRNRMTLLRLAKLLEEV